MSPTAWWEAGLRLLMAMALGGVIGWQRESAEKPAGFRTHILVAVGAALFTLISAVGFFGSGADPARVASNIVVGIGFLGAGTIFRTSGSVQGLTTAASLWTVAAMTCDVCGRAVADDEHMDRATVPAEQGDGLEQISDALELCERRDVADDGHPLAEPEATTEASIRRTRREPLGVDGIGDDHDPLDRDASLRDLLAHRLGQGDDRVGLPDHRRLDFARALVAFRFDGPGSGPR